MLLKWYVCPCYTAQMHTQIHTFHVILYLVVLMVLMVLVVLVVRPVQVGICNLLMSNRILICSLRPLSLLCLNVNRREEQREGKEVIL